MLKAGGLRSAIDEMASAVCGVLVGNAPSVYLTGSVVLDDFQPGWSDIDVLVLTEGEITEKQAGKLIFLRQEMLDKEPENEYYRSFEGGMLTAGAFLSGKPDRVVYWGTSGQRIDTVYRFDAFSSFCLLEHGVLLCGRDVRDRMHRPTYGDLKAGIRAYLKTVRDFSHLSGKSLYSFGWMLDVSRCIYTLETGEIIAKTKAGEWALREGVCPVPETLAYALKVRRSPLDHKTDEKTLEYASSINADVQSYADVLERLLNA